MFKGRHFDRSVILLCVRWYQAYSLSLRDLEEMMAERGIAVDHATIHRRTVHYSVLLLDSSIGASARSPAGGMSTKRISSCAANGGICTGPSTATATRWNSGSANDAIRRL